MFEKEDILAKRRPPNFSESSRLMRDTFEGEVRSLADLHPRSVRFVLNDGEISQSDLTTKSARARAHVVDNQLTFSNALPRPEIKVFSVVRSKPNYNTPARIAIKRIYLSVGFAIDASSANIIPGRADLLHFKREKRCNLR